MTNEQFTDATLGNLTPEQRKELAGQLSASLGNLPDVERTPTQLLSWLQIDETIVELMSMHAEAEERIAELTATQGTATFQEFAEREDVQSAVIERDAIAAEIQLYMRQEVAKVDGIARFRHFLGRMVDGSKEEAKRAAARHKSWENRKASLDGFIMFTLDAMGKTRVETASNRLRIQNNPESVEVTDPAAIGDEFVEVQLTCTLATYKSMLKDFGPNAEVRFKRGPQTFKLAAIGAAIKETVKQPCEKCGGQGKIHFSEMGGDGPGQSQNCGPCLGTGFKRFLGAKMTRGRHLRVE